MNWFDLIIIVIMASSVFYGLRVGLIKAIFVSLGAYVGWILAGQWSDDLGNILGETIGNKTLLTVISYLLIITAIIYITNFSYKFLRPLMTGLTLGFSSLVDRAGGIVLGIIIGIIISSAIIIGFTRLTYSLLDGNIAEKVPLQQVHDVKDGLQSSLSESTFVPLYVKTFQKIPDSLLGNVPPEFKFVINLLQDEINRLP